jgi:hypothetical protein
MTAIMLITPGALSDCHGRPAEGRRSCRSYSLLEYSYDRVCHCGIHVIDAAHNVVPAELLAMQGR